MENIELKFKHILVEQLGIEDHQFKPEARFDELKCDSLDAVEIVIACEDAFGITILDEDVEKLNTIGEALEWLKARV